MPTPSPLAKPLQCLLRPTSKLVLVHAVQGPGSGIPSSDDSVASRQHPYREMRLVYVVQRAAHCNTSEETAVTYWTMATLNERHS